MKRQKQQSQVSLEDFDLSAADMLLLMLLKSEPYLTYDGEKRKMLNTMMSFGLCREIGGLRWELTLDGHAICEELEEISLANKLSTGHPEEVSGTRMRQGLSTLEEEIAKARNDYEREGYGFMI